MQLPICKNTVYTLHSAPLYILPHNQAVPHISPLKCTPAHTCNFPLSFTILYILFSQKLHHLNALPLNLFKFKCG